MHQPSHTQRRRGRMLFRRSLLRPSGQPQATSAAVLNRTTSWKTCGTRPRSKISPKPAGRRSLGASWAKGWRLLPLVRWGMVEPWHTRAGHMQLAHSRLNHAYNHKCSMLVCVCVYACACVCVLGCARVDARSHACQLGATPADSSNSQAISGWAEAQGYNAPLQAISLLG
jgi:hypothetical protein